MHSPKIKNRWILLHFSKLKWKTPKISSASSPRNASVINSLETGAVKNEKTA